MSTPEFTAHNIELDDGTWTHPGSVPVAGNPVCRTALRLLSEHFPGPAGQVRVADLGALEGGYAVAFARAGYQVTAIEVRERNMAKCQIVAAATALPNLELIRDDARNLAAYGTFDAVFCCGLLYHLDRPREFLAMLGTVTRRLLILQTHISLSPDTLNEGLPGHWYSDNSLPDDLWGSWGNPRSFWLATTALLQAIAEAGFTRAEAVDDGTGAPDRGMFAGVKS